MRTLILNFLDKLVLKVKIDETLPVSALIDRLIITANTGEDRYKLFEDMLPSQVQNDLWMIKVYFQGAKREQFLPSTGDGRAEPLAFIDCSIREWLAKHDKHWSVQNAFIFRGPRSYFFMGIAQERSKEEFITTFLKGMNENILRVFVPFKAISHFKNEELHYIAQHLADSIIPINIKFKEIIIWEAPDILKALDKKPAKRSVFAGAFTWFSSKARDKKPIAIPPTIPTPYKFNSSIEKNIEDPNILNFKQELEARMLGYRNALHNQLQAQFPHLVAGIVEGYLGVETLLPPSSSSDPKEQSPSI